MKKHDIDVRKIESLEVFKKLAPIARNSVGINTAEPALLSAMLYLLDRIDTNLEKLVERMEAPKADIAVDMPVENETAEIPAAGKAVKDSKK